MQKLMLLAGLLLLSILPFMAEGKDPCHFSTEGTDFWFGLMQNRLKGIDHSLEITVSSRKGADFTVTYGPNETLIGDFSVGANSSQAVSIDYSILEASGSETIENKGIHLHANDSVNVYALNFRTQSSDVAVIYPTESLGKEYFAMCYKPNPANGNESNSEFLIVATKDNTKVTITPAVDTDRSKKAGQTFVIILNKGQSYQVQSNNSNIFGQGDLTGSYILASEPIAFYSGALSTSVPYSTAQDNSRDHLYEQIPPTNTWGREFYVVPLQQRQKDTYRILAAEDETTVTIEAINRTKTLKRGEFFEFDLTNSQACRIISTKKVLLAQYCRTQNADSYNGVGDPFMIILSPISQKINDVTFVAYESDLIQDMFYVNITTLTSEVDQILLDDKIIRKELFKTFPNQKYAYAQLPIGKGPHRLNNPNKDGGFLAYVYGFGERTESYGYGVGFNLDIQLEIGGSFETVDDAIQICYGNSVKLEAGEYFQSYQWSTGETSPSIMASQEKWYSILATTNAGCKKKDSLYVKVDRPVINLGPDKAVCLPGELVIEAENGFRTYKWQDGTINQTYTVDSTGYYSVVVTNQFDCLATDTIHVEVIIPKIDFEPDYPVVTIEHPEIKFTNLTKGDLSYIWDFGDGKTSNLPNPTHQFSDIKTYHVALTAVSKLLSNCSNSFGMDVKVIPFKFNIPNAFRPSSGIEENRILKPVLNAVDPENYKLQIFNRLGSNIFESTNPEKGWDGANAEQGVYIWMVRYLDFQGYEHAQKGTVMLVP
jgi:hypothetical protein